MSEKSSHATGSHSAVLEDSSTPFLDEISKGPWPSHCKGTEKDTLPGTIKHCFWISIQ